MKKPSKSSDRASLPRGLRESVLLILVALGAYLMLALLTYHPSDPRWTQASLDLVANNLGGTAGAWFADLFFFLFGYLAYLAPVMVAYSGWLLYRGGTETQAIDYRTLGWRWAGFVLTLAAGCGLATLHFQPVFLPGTAGGVLGDVVGTGFLAVFNYVGATLLLLALFFAGITVFSHFSLLWLLDMTGKCILKISSWLWRLISLLKEKHLGKQARTAREKVVKAKKVKIQKSPPRIEPTVEEITPSVRAERERQIPLFDSVETALPPTSMLDNVAEDARGYSDDALEAMSRQVELKLLDFGIEAAVVEVHPGPVITRFELQLAAGIKVSKVSNLAKDLARALSVVSVRIVEVIPGKSHVGLEIPNEYRELVVLSDILRSETYDESSSILTLALGKDISGRPVVVDLAKMPHLLVAGTTGSGKSVALNAMLLSILYKATPQQVRIILIDP